MILVRITDSHIVLIRWSGNGPPFLFILIFTNQKEVSRFQNCVKQIALKKEREYQRSIATFGSIESILSLNQYNVKVE
jgi:hypothetical protein